MKVFIGLVIFTLTHFGLNAQDDSRIGISFGQNKFLTFNEPFNESSSYVSQYLNIERVIMYPGSASFTYGLKINKNDVFFNDKTFIGTVISPAENIGNYSTLIFGAINGYFFESNFFAGIQFGYEFGLTKWESSRNPTKGPSLHAIVGYDIHIGDDFVITLGAVLGKRFINFEGGDFEGGDYSFQISVYRKFW